MRKSDRVFGLKKRVQMVSRPLLLARYYILGNVVSAPPLQGVSRANWSRWGYECVFVCVPGSARVIRAEIASEIRHAPLISAAAGGAKKFLTEKPQILAVDRPVDSHFSTPPQGPESRF